MLLRILFILYAEDKGLLPIHNPLYHQTYSIGGLWVQLHEDHKIISDSLEKEIWIVGAFVCAISTYVSWLRILRIIYAFETGRSI